ncbi:hypothetical protein BU25DRAFT_414672 [Macroventuria anomochaeta]|uniref:Uncharacterized protein n=1 Tax=Macroventuria anomochaeta TaxID=301207 RepID=A0ACB6RMB5_9PLEO|nr:uncharacterized protein BU25DRAFT_414672 [Macroventuria anomochaeta]KAF2623166.1 hypothetical protein BU25DRAFT_414672 [Macroventuria anomochaeta]
MRPREAGMPDRDPAVRSVALLHPAQCRRGPISNGHPFTRRIVRLIHCQLNVHSLVNAPHYRTISYAWGDSRDTAPIIVDVQSSRFPAASSHVLDICAVLEAC